MPGFTGNARLIPPNLNTQLLPESERESAAQVGLSRFSLGNHAGAFQAAVALFDLAEDAADRETDPEKRQTYTDWKFIAARDGAMTVNGFVTALENILASLKHCPSIILFINKEKLREVKNLLRAHFPNYKKVRHAVAHVEDLKESEDSKRKNSARGPMSRRKLTVAPGAAVFISNGLIGREYTCTINGEMHSYSVSSETLANLVYVMRAFYDMFCRLDPDSSSSP